MLFLLTACSFSRWATELLFLRKARLQIYFKYINSFNVFTITGWCVWNGPQWSCYPRKHSSVGGSGAGQWSLRACSLASPLSLLLCLDEWGCGEHQLGAPSAVEPTEPSPPWCSPTMHLDEPFFLWVVLVPCRPSEKSQMKGKELILTKSMICVQEGSVLKIPPNTNT